MCSFVFVWPVFDLFSLPLQMKRWQGCAQTRPADSNYVRLGCLRAKYSFHKYVPRFLENPFYLQDIFPLNTSRGRLALAHAHFSPSRQCRGPSLRERPK